MKINAFTLKELRQLTRSRVVAIGLALYLTLAFAASYAIPLEGITQHTGTNVFDAVNTILMVAIAGILPLDAFARLFRERGANGRADFTLLTTLPPVKVIDGKLCAAGALIILFVLATLPFAVFSYILHGIAPEEMAGRLLVSAAVGLANVSLAVAAGSLRASRVVRLAAVLVAGGAAFIFDVIVFAILMDLGTADFGTFALAAAIALTLALLARGFAVAFLSPEAIEREKPMRRAVAASVAGWAIYVLAQSGGAAYDFEEALAGWMMFSGGAFLAVAAFASVQKVEGRKVDGRRMPGAAGAFVFAVIGLALVALAIPAMKPWVDARYAAELTAMRVSGSSFQRLNWYLAPGIFFMYAMATLLLVRAVWRWTASLLRVRPGVVPVAATVLFAFLVSLPGLLSILCGTEASSYRALPFNLDGIEQYPFRHLAYSAAAFAFALAVNARALVAAMRKALRKNERARPPESGCAP